MCTLMLGLSLDQQDLSYKLKLHQRCFQAYGSSEEQAEDSSSLQSSNSFEEQNYNIYLKSMISNIMKKPNILNKGYLQKPVKIRIQPDRKFHIDCEDDPLSFLEAAQGLCYLLILQKNNKVQQQILKQRSPNKIFFRRMFQIGQAINFATQRPKKDDDFNQCIARYSFICPVHLPKDQFSKLLNVMKDRVKTIHLYSLEINPAPEVVKIINNKIRELKIDLQKFIEEEKPETKIQIKFEPQLQHFLNNLPEQEKMSYQLRFFQEISLEQKTQANMKYYALKCMVNSSFSELLNNKEKYLQIFQKSGIQYDENLLKRWIEDPFNIQNNLSLYKKSSIFSLLVNQTIRASSDPYYIFWVQPFVYGQYWSIRERGQYQLRSGKFDSLKQDKQSPYLTVYRYSFITKSFIKRLKKLIGQHIYLQGFISTSLTQKGTQKFVSNCFSEIRIPLQKFKEEGMSSHGFVYLENYHQGKGISSEDEILINILNQLKVVAVDLDSDPNKYKIILELVSYSQKNDQKPCVESFSNDEVDPCVNDFVENQRYLKSFQDQILCPGDVYYYGEKWLKAIFYYEKYLNQVPKPAKETKIHIYYHLGMAYLKAGRFTKSREFLSPIKNYIGRKYNVGHHLYKSLCYSLGVCHVKLRDRYKADLAFTEIMRKKHQSFKNHQQQQEQWIFQDFLEREYYSNKIQISTSKKEKDRYQKILTEKENQIFQKNNRAYSKVESKSGPNSFPTMEKKYAKIMLKPLNSNSQKQQVIQNLICLSQQIKQLNFWMQDLYSFVVMEICYLLKETGQDKKIIDVIKQYIDVYNDKNPEQFYQDQAQTNQQIAKSALHIILHQNIAIDPNVQAFVKISLLSVLQKFQPSDPIFRIKKIRREIYSEIDYQHLSPVGQLHHFFNQITEYFNLKRRDESAKRKFMSLIFRNYFTPSVHKVFKSALKSFCKGLMASQTSEIHDILVKNRIQLLASEQYHEAELFSYETKKRELNQCPIPEQITHLFYNKPD